MRRSEAFPSQFLGKDDVPQPFVAHINDVGKQTVKGDGGDEDKAVMTFRERIKPMILNNTNWMAIEDAYGEESDDWSGKPIEIFVDPSVMFGGKRVGGVRVRIPSTNNPAAPNGGQPSTATETTTTATIQSKQSAPGQNGQTVWIIDTDQGEFGTIEQSIADQVPGVGLKAYIKWTQTPKGGRKIVSIEEEPPF